MNNELILSCTLPDLCESGSKAIETLLPEKSRKIYTSAYTDFTKWRTKKGTISASETVLLAYFTDIGERYKPSSLWAIYSMLKSTLSIQENINIKNYHQLSSFLKKKSRGFKSKKSRVLSTQNVNEFINEAPDEHYLVSKIALIFGIFGACRSQELVDCKIQDVVRQGEIFVVHIPNTKTKKPRTFTINQNYADIIQKYCDLRTSKATTDRFFLKVLNGQCTVQVVGRNKFAKIPQEIAKFLKLENPELYTGHCFRRTSATVVADSRALVTTLKRCNEWKSNSVAEGCTEESIQNKAKQDPFSSEPQSCSSETPNPCSPYSNVEAINELYNIQIKNEDIIDIDEHPIKQECLVNESITDTLHFRGNLNKKKNVCIFCNYCYGRDTGPLRIGDKEPLKKALQMFKELLKNSTMYKIHEMHEKIETLPQLYYHYCCQTDFFDFLYDDMIEGSQIKCQVTKCLHEKTFEEICKIIEENIIEKGQCYPLGDLIQEYISLMKKFAADGHNCYLVFSKKHFKRKLFSKFSNIKIISTKYNKIIIPRDREVGDEFRALLEEKDILQKAALILRKKILDINVSGTIEGELRVPESLIDFCTTLLNESVLRPQSSFDYYRKINSMVQDTISIVSHSKLNTEKHGTFREASENLTNNREVIDISTYMQEGEAL